MMAPSLKLSQIECGKHPKHRRFISLLKFTVCYLPEEYRSQRYWAFIYMKATLVVKLRLPKDEDQRSGFIFEFDDSDADIIKFRVRTVAHEGYDNVKKIIPTVIFPIPGTHKVLLSRNIVLEKPVCTDTQNDILDDVATLSVIFKRSSFSNININTLADIRNALTPSIDTLSEFVLRKYNTEKFSLRSFMKNAINCIKDIKLSSGKAVFLEIQLQVENLYLIDVILFVFGFASHPDDFRELMKKNADGSDTNIATFSSAVNVVSTQIFTEYFGILDKHLTSLCSPLPERIIDDVNLYISRLFPFKISFELTTSNDVIMIVGTTTQICEEVEMGAGKDLQTNAISMAIKRKDKEMTELHGLRPSNREDIKEQNRKLQNSNPKSEMEIGNHDLDIGLDAINVQEEQGTRSSCLDRRRKKELGEEDNIFTGLGYDKTNEKADLTLVTMKSQNKKPIKESENEETLTVLISCPHGRVPPYLTFGYQERSLDKEVFYTNPSCPGSSGGLLCLIPGKPGTELRDIRFASHKSGTDVKDVHVAANADGSLKGKRCATASTDMEDDSVGVLVDL